MAQVKTVFPVRTVSWVKASEAKVMQDAGSWIENPNTLKHPEKNEPKKIFQATYSVHWRPRAEQQTGPFTDDDACEVTQIGDVQ